MASQAEIVEFLQAQFPQMRCRVEAVGNAGATLRYRVSQDSLRPGGTVAGPVLFTTADAALYVAILGEIGIVPLAVTTNLNLNFLRRPGGDADIIGVCKLLKVGRRLATGEVTLYSDGDPLPVAHATGSYAIPAQ